MDDADWHAQIDWTEVESQVWSVEDYDWLLEWLAEDDDMDDWEEDSDENVEYYDRQRDWAEEDNS